MIEWIMIAYRSKKMRIQGIAHEYTGYGMLFYSL